MYDCNFDESEANVQVLFLFLKVLQNKSGQACICSRLHLNINVINAVIIVLTISEMVAVLTIFINAHFEVNYTEENTF